MTTGRRSNDFSTSGAAGVAQALADVGVTHVFGIPGGDTGLIFRALAARSDIRTVVVRHESLASVMAEVQGRLSGRVGVLIGQAPWIAGLGIIGTLESLLSSSPMLILTDLSESRGLAMHGAYQDGSGNYGSWDARTTLSGTTKRVIEIRRPVDAVIGTQLAIKHASNGEPGPVAVLYTREALEGVVQTTRPPYLYPTERMSGLAPRGVSTAELRTAAAALVAAEHPIIIAGNGVRVGRAGPALAKFAERFDMPVATSAAGKGVFPEQHDLALGVYGNFGTERANEAVAHADLVLVLGSKLGASDTAFENDALLNPERQTFVHVDIEPLNVSWTFPADHAIVGDITDVLEQFSAVLPPEYSAGGICPRCSSAEAAEDTGHGDDRDGIRPQDVISALERVVGSTGRVVCDAGENRIFMTHFYRTGRPDGFMQAAGAGPMGYAIPAAMGVKLLYPDEVVVAVVGDGGFAMTMSGLLTAIEEEIPICVLLMNNRSFGWSFHGGSLSGSFPDFNYADIAAAMGCRSYRVTDGCQLEEVMSEAFMRPGKTPVVVEVLVSLDMTFRDVTSPLAK